MNESLLLFYCAVLLVRSFTELRQLGGFVWIQFFLLSLRTKISLCPSPRNCSPPRVPGKPDWDFSFEAETLVPLALARIFPQILSTDLSRRLYSCAVPWN